MKFLKTLSVLILMLCLAVSLLPLSAFAEDAVVSDERFDGKTWEEVVESFIAENGTDPDRVTFGYKNTVTGEEHYYNGDKYMVSGSMFKVPLNMYYAEKVYNGEMTMDTTINGIPYSKLQEWTIVNSDNTMAEYLWRNIGTYHHYRELICPYMGVEADTVADKYYENNFFTAEQMIHCLNMLATEPDRFPGVIDVMLKAEPNNYFKFRQQDYSIAHKYGYLAEGSTLYLNDCAIAYTDDPIVFVMFSSTIADMHIYVTMTEFCRLMCDYAQYHTAIRRAEQAEADEKAAIAALNAGSGTAGAESGGSETGGQSSAPSGTGNTSGSSVSASSFVEKSFGIKDAALAVIIAAAAIIALCAVLSNRKKIAPLYGTAAVLLTALAMLLCIYASSKGMLISGTEGDPQDTVSGFLDSVVSGRYASAYSYLKDYTSLGLDALPSSESGSAMYEALRESYSYKFYGDSAVDGLTAKQQVLFRYLDITKAEAEVREKTAENMNNYIENRPVKEMYDEEGKFFPSVTDEAYNTALNSVLAHAQDYYTTVAFEVSLDYVSGQWYIQTSPEMLSAFMGGIS